MSNVYQKLLKIPAMQRAKLDWTPLCVEQRAVARKEDSLFSQLRNTTVHQLKSKWQR